MCDKSGTDDWEGVLIDWINCLKLHKPLKSIEELRDGVFLGQLRRLIKKSTDPIPGDDLTALFELVAHRYPKIAFNQMDSIHISDLPRVDLVHLTSLLLHYTCIYDKRNELTSPMCNSLRASVQLLIKRFLELVYVEITMEELADIVKTICSSSNHKKVSRQLMSVINTPQIKKKSPLQDVFNTPAWKYAKLHEKDQKIDKLQRELDIEKYEKGDLQTELKDQIQKLQNQLKHKCLEVESLKNQIISLEMRTPPHFQDLDSCRTQELLRKEILSLEKYVQLCNSEYEEMRAERDLMREKAKTLENDFKTMQEKCFTFEKNCQDLEEQTRTFEDENRALKSLCEELERFRDNFRSKSTTSLDDSIQATSFVNRRSRSLEPVAPYEDLAHSVVDVQLKEVQKQLEDALKDLDVALNENRLLESDLEGFKETNERICSENAETKVELKRVMDDFQRISIENESIKAHLEATNKDLQEIRLNRAQIETELTERTKELSDCIEKMFKKDQEHQKVLDELSKALENNKTRFEASIKEKTEYLANVEQKLAETTSEIAAIATRLAEKEELHQNALRNLKLADLESSNLLQEKQEVVLRLEEANEALNTAKLEKERLISDLESTSEGLKEVQAHLRQVSKDLERVKLENDAVKSNLETANRDLQDTRFKKAQIETELMERTKELSDCVEKMSEKEQEHQKVLDELSKALENNKTRFEASIKEKTEYLAHVELKLAETTSEAAAIATQLAEKEELHQNALRNLKLANLESLNLLQEKQDVVLRLEEANEALNMTKLEKERLISNLESTSGGLKEVQAHLQQVSKDLDRVKLENDFVKSNLETANRDLQDTRFKKAQIETELSERTKELSDCLEKISEKDQEHQKALDVLSKALENNKTSFDEYITTVEAKLTEITAEKSAIAAQLAETEDLRQKASKEANLQVAKLHQEKNEASKRLTNIEEKIKTIKLEKESVNFYLKDTVKQLEETEDKLAETTKKLMVSDKQIKAITSEKVRLEHEFIKREENLSKELNEAKHNVTKLSKQLREALAEKSDVETNLADAQNRLQSAAQHLQTALEQKDQAEIKLGDTLLLLTETREKTNELQKVLTNFKCETEGMQKGLSQALEQLSGQMAIKDTKIEELCEELIEKKRELMEFRNVQSLLEQSQAENSRLLKEFREFEAKFSRLGVERDEIARKLAEVVEQNIEISEQLVVKSSVLEELNNIKEECESARVYYKKLEDALEKLNAKEQELESLEIQISEKDNNLCIYLAEIESLKNDLILSESAAQHFSTLLEDLAEKLDISKSESDNESQKHQLLQRVEHLMDEVRTVKEQKHLLENTLDATKAKLERFEKAVKELEDELTRTLKESQRSQEEKLVLSNFLDLKDNELTELTQERDQLLEALEMSNQDKLGLERKLVELLNENNKLHNDKTEIVENFERIVKEKAQLFSELTNVSVRLENLQKDHQELQNGHLDNQSEIKKLLLSNRELTELLEVTRRDREGVYVNFEQVQKQQKDLENEYQKLLIEKNDIAKEKNDIYDSLQKYVEEKEVVALENDQLQSENVQLKRERDDLHEKLQNIAEEKQKLSLSLELSQKEACKVKKERNQILQSQTEIMKETESNILRAHEVAVEERRELLKRLESAEKDRDKVREAYSVVVGANSRYELENVSLRKTIEERNQDIKQYSQIKEAYEKLLETNDRYSGEIESLRYKRSKDREEFLRLLRKEREDGEAREGKRVKTIRAEYEEKLEKMKDKMLKLYREELGKEMQKVKGERGDGYLQKVVDRLEDELFRLKHKLQVLETSKDRYASLESVATEKTLTKPGRGRGNKVADRDSVLSANNGLAALRREHVHEVRSATNLHGRESTDQLTYDKKTATLPPRLRQGDFIEETITLSRRTSINSLGRNFEMEDEQDDMFNNKYLADLQEGRCMPQTGRESNVNRMSELMWRNSMVPAHLKSSYPAEMQFVSPTRFKEDEIKTGNVEMEDSMCRLLPAEKPRQKKDFGTTSYKKPGPPTPSKNGGRPSLQGHEIQPLREANNAASIPKKVTPGRMRALFKGLTEGSGGRENAENVTPRATKRISFFKNRR